jgi:predicted transposase/invertase (TIGR01784 family)
LFFLFKNLHKLDSIPPKLKQAAFESIFEKAQIAKFKPAECQAYEDSLKYYRDIKNSIDTARDDGKIEGKAEGIEIGKEIGKQEGIELGERNKALAIARNMLSQGLDIALIAQITGLTLEQVESLSPPLLILVLSQWKMELRFQRDGTNLYKKTLFFMVK